MSLFFLLLSVQPQLVCWPCGGALGRGELKVVCELLLHLRSICSVMRCTLVSRCDWQSRMTEKVALTTAVLAPACATPSTTAVLYDNVRSRCQTRRSLPEQP